MMRELTPYLAPEAKDFDVYMGNLEGIKDVLTKYAQMKPAKFSSTSTPDTSSSVQAGAELEWVTDANGNRKLVIKK